jgi:hypothetical protein
VALGEFILEVFERNFITPAPDHGVARFEKLGHECPA